MRPTLAISLIVSILLASLVLAGSKEVQRGNYWDAILRDGLPLYEDSDVSRQVTEIGEDIVAASQNPHNLEFRFFVLNSSEPTAFAAPGGTVYVTTALLQNLTSRDELAAVLAHEVGHVNRKDGMKVGMGPGTRKFWSTLIYVGATAASVYLGQVVANSIPADYTMMGADGLLYEVTRSQQAMFELTAWAVQKGTSAMGQRVVQSFFKGYRKEFEFEADLLALDYTRRASYQPEALVNVLERLGGGGLSGSTAISHLHSSKELLAERTNRAKLLIAE